MDKILGPENEIEKGGGNQWDTTGIGGGGMWKGWGD